MAPSDTRESRDPVDRRELRFAVEEDAGEVSALLVRPATPRCLLVLGHGAGAGMEHPFLETVSRRLAERSVATLRYQFPYMEAGRRFPGPLSRRLAAVRSAVRAGRELEPELPLLAGGKSMGGRMTSRAAAEELLPGVAGLVFLGFPLHSAGKPSRERGEHLSGVDLPMLFVQGTRDRLADLDLLRPVVAGLGSRATLHVVEGGDHSFGVLKRSGRSTGEVMAELADAVAGWAERVVPEAS